MTIFLAVSLCNLTHVIAHKAACAINVLRRDISPENILITDDGGLLMDWDLSKVIDPNGKHDGAQQTVN